MILKLIPHHTANYKRLIEYVLKEGKGLSNTKPEAITHNLRGTTVAEWVEQFQRVESFRLHSRRDQVLLRHEVLSFNKLDSGNISKEMLTDFANEYIRQRGIGGIYLMAIHQDATNYHIHACVSGVRLDGMSSTISKPQLKELKQNLQVYHQQKFPEIKHSNPQHGKGKEYVTHKEHQARLKETRALEKDRIREMVAACFAKAESQEHYLALLRDENLHHYERNTKIQGIISETGIKYRFSRLDIDFYKLPYIRTDMKKEQHEKNQDVHQVFPPLVVEMQAQDLQELVIALELQAELADLKAERETLLLELAGNTQLINDPEFNRRIDAFLQKENDIVNRGEAFIKTQNDEKLLPGERGESLWQNTEHQSIVNGDGVTKETGTEINSNEIINAEHQHEEPDIDANPELFNFEAEGDIDIPDEGKQEILDELDDLRNDADEMDKDEYNRDYDEDELER